MAVPLHRMVFGALLLPLACGHSLVLVHAEELQVCEWFPEKSSLSLTGPRCGPSFTPNTRRFSCRLRCFQVGGSPGTGHILLSIRFGFGMPDIYIIAVLSEFNGVLIVFSCHPFGRLLLSNGLTAFGFRRVLHLLSNQPARGEREQS